MTGKGRVSPTIIVAIIVGSSLVVGAYVFLDGIFSLGESAALAMANCIFLLLLWRLVVKFMSQ